jgi:hypothetical protein
MEDILGGVNVVEDMVEEKGFSDKLLAAILEFSSNIDNNNSIQYLNYNYKRNNFYPFIPTAQKIGIPSRK